MSEEQLPESKLGTKQHWDDVYQREISTFDDIGEEGEVWFGTQSAKKMLTWTIQNLPPSLDPPPRILDLGTGNGYNLFLLSSKRGKYPGAVLKGVDYSQGSVDLARLIRDKRASGEVESSDEDDSDDDEQDNESGWTDSTADISFDAADILRGDPIDGGPWDLVTDKGTYDAIALSSDPIPPTNLSPAELYPIQVSKLVKPGGYFLITSCNFTEEEIKKRFTKSTLGFSYHSRVNHPTFTFGGSKGSTVCTVAFQKTASHAE
ncbi:Methyltransferases [Phaffia rhodozyma]|uniref:Protein-lysine N-methyltransferase EFM4 n=1 Tax=Phaffia rhodozyma TaxID=264483 RepID=A0A0F7SF88_PHARH|nr:Methyltransferases [Phaffia rhodozyma]